MDFEEKITTTAAEIEAVRTMKDFRNPIYISVDEWGTFGRNFLSVLPIAECLNSFIRHADVVKMGNFTMFTGLLASDREKGTFKSPLFETFKLFSTNCRGNSIDTYVAVRHVQYRQVQGHSFPRCHVSVFERDKNSLHQCCQQTQGQSHYR